MSGIVFLSTADRDGVVTFYRERLGFELWVEQPGCTILSHDNLLLGFCEDTTPETDGVVTLLYEDRATVDERYAALSDVATDEPAYNETYDIYQFFGEDPEGRTLEFQTFEHETPPV